MVYNDDNGVISWNQHKAVPKKKPVIQKAQLRAALTPEASDRQGTVLWS